MNRTFLSRFTPWAVVAGPMFSFLCLVGCTSANPPTDSALLPEASGKTASPPAPPPPLNSVAASASVPVGSALAETPKTPPADPTPTAADWQQGMPPIVPQPHTETGPRVYAKSRFVWVHYQPGGSTGWKGYLWMGGSAPLIDDKPVIGQGSCKAWYKVKPSGFVCVDGDKATLDPNDPVYVAIKKYAPKLESPWPHFYGESMQAERYFHFPSAKEQRRREWDLVAHQEHIAAALAGKERHRSLVDVDLNPGKQEPFLFEKLPTAIREDRPRIYLGSAAAWSAETEYQGRSWLLTGDYAIIPKDRVKVYPKSYFHGTAINDKVQLPLAFFRGKDRPKYKLDDSGNLTESKDKFARLTWVGLTGKSKKQAKEVFLETKEQGVWINEKDTTIAKTQEKTPWGAPVGGEDTTGKAPKGGRQTWVEISVLGGWLIAYEGTKPVFATLISPGRGGIPELGKDPVDTASTPVGTWPVTGKFATATMVTDPTLVHSDVPWTQNFHGPHALHGAYWHDVWGEKKSGGCVNLAPIDGRWFFYWTEPQLPEGWHGMRSDKEFGPQTAVVVHK
jgi:hypothetical protein